MGKGEQNYVFSFGEPDCEKGGEKREGSMAMQIMTNVGMSGGQCGEGGGPRCFVFSVAISLFKRVSHSRVTKIQKKMVAFFFCFGC